MGHLLNHLVPAPVESGVEAEIEGLTEARPGLAEMALAMARILDNPKAVNQQPAAARVLVLLLDKLSSASAQRRRGNLVVVRALTNKGDVSGCSGESRAGQPLKVSRR
jgi:hypothetical protein